MLVVGSTVNWVLSIAYHRVVSIYEVVDRRRGRCGVGSHCELHGDSRRGAGQIRRNPADGAAYGVGSAAGAGRHQWSGMRWSRQPVH